MPPKTRLQMSFASAVTSSKPTEVCVRDIFNLQEKVLLLQQENFELKARLLALEQKLQNIETEGKQEVVKTVLQECASSPHLVSKVKDILTDQVNEMQDKMSTEVKDKVENQVSFELKERQQRDKLALKVRIGGLPAWRGQNIDEALDSIMKAMPTIAWKAEAVHTIDRSPQNHAILEFETKEDRLAILRQTKSLKGTKLWISEELTPYQLKVKAAELQKVKEARKNGKWAVYREGRALIKDFELKSTDTHR